MSITLDMFNVQCSAKYRTVIKKKTQNKRTLLSLDSTRKVENMCQRTQ